METVYQKYRPASDILMEYYAYCEIRGFIEDDWKREDTKFKAQCDKLYEEYKIAAAKEKDIKENSKICKDIKEIRTDEID